MRFTQIKKYVDLLFKTKFEFKIPKKNKLILFDDIGEEYLRKINKFFYILDIRFNKLNITCLLLSLFYKKCSDNMKLNYYLNLIKFVKPKIIITFNDNRLDFYKLKKYLPQILFISVQNGWRGYKDDIFERLDKEENKNLSCDYILNFNQSVSNKLKKHILSKYFNIGSFRSNNYTISETQTKDICIISQFQKYSNIDDVISIYGKKPITWANFMKSDELVFKKIDNLRLDKKYNLKVYLRNTNSFVDIEKNYFKNIFKKSKIIFIKKNNLKSMFSFLDKCKLIITVDSTLGYEMLSRGKKVIFVTARDYVSNFFLGHSYGWPMKLSKNGPFWCSNLDSDYINNIIINVLNMNKNEWNKTFKTYNCIDRDHNNKQLVKILKNAK